MHAVRWIDLVPVDDCRALIEYIDAGAAPAGLAVAEEAYQKIVDQYRDPKMADPAKYRANVTVVLSEYSPMVLARVADVRTGIARTHKFFPEVAEFVEACETEKNRYANLKWIAMRVIEEREKRIREAEEKRRIENTPRISAERIQEIVRQSRKD